MTQTKLVRLLQTAADALTHKRVDTLVGLFALPAAAYLDDKVALLQSRESAADRIQKYLSDLAALGVTQVSVGDVKTTVQSNRKCIVRATWRMCGADGAVAFHTLCDLYVREQADGVPRIEMVDIVHSTSPALHRAMGSTPATPQA